MKKLLGILVAGFVLMGGAVQAHDGGHCTEAEFLEFEGRIGVWLLETTGKLSGEELEDPLEFVEWFAVAPAAMLAEDAMYDWFSVRMGEGLGMSESPRLCEEIVPIYLAALRILRVFPLSYILVLDERLQGEDSISSSEQSRLIMTVPNALSVEIENAIAGFDDATKAGYAVMGLEYTRDDASG